MFLRDWALGTLTGDEWPFVYVPPVSVSVSGAQSRKNDAIPPKWFNSLDTNSSTIWVFLQQYNYRYSAIQHGLSNLEYDYLKNNVADSKKRKKGNGNRKRKIDHSSGYGLFSSASNNGYKKRKIDSDNNSSGYGIISAASNAYKVISE